MNLSNQVPMSLMNRDDRVVSPGAHPLSAARGGARARRGLLGACGHRRRGPPHDDGGHGAGAAADRPSGVWPLTYGQTLRHTTRPSQFTKHTSIQGRRQNIYADLNTHKQALVALVGDLGWEGSPSTDDLGTSSHDLGASSRQSRQRHARTPRSRQARG